MSHTFVRFIGVSWFLWSTVYPGGPSQEKDIRSQPVHEYATQEACEKGLKEYRTEVDKAFPEPPAEPGETSRWVTWPTVKLQCSPIYPR